MVLRGHNPQEPPTPPRNQRKNLDFFANRTELTYTAPNINATKNDWINYAEGFLDSFQVIKFRFLAFIFVPGGARQPGMQKSSLIVPRL